MRFGFRHGDNRYPFFWESSDQPAARWHGPGEGPVQYLADTPDGAWAEFLRHEEIHDPADLAGIARRLWAVELPAEVASAVRPELDDPDLLGGPSTYPRCQEEARRLRATGGQVIVAPSAALRPGGAGGQLTNGGLKEAPAQDGVVWVLAGARPDLRGWVAVDAGGPPERTLYLVRHLDGNVGAAERRQRNRRSGTDRRSTIDLTQGRQSSEWRSRAPLSDRRRASERRQNPDKPG